MKKLQFLYFLCAVLLFLTWCDEFCDTSTKKITETIWNWTCVWQWVDKIEWQANCKTQDWWTYVWDVWWHNFNWKWKLITSNWEIRDGYFYNWSFIAGKVSFSNGDALKWLRTIIDNWASILESWKMFNKNSWVTIIWDFDENFNLKYWMKSYNWFMTAVWEFRDWDIYNWYISFDDSCWTVSNWNIKETTKTVTNTVYRNNWLTSSLGKQWTVLNPYVVNVNVKKWY